MGNKKIKFIYIVGVEGCGHHGLIPVVHKALNSYKNSGNENITVHVHWTKLRDIFHKLWSFSGYLPFDINRGINKRKTEKTVKDLNDKALKMNKVHFILESRSFPSDRYRRCFNQWNIKEMADIFKPYADIFYLVLHRDPIAMTFSHKDFDGGLRQHAKVVARFLRYLNCKLAEVDTEFFRVINYEDLIDNQKSIGLALSNFLGIPLQDIREGLKAIRRSKKDWKTQMSYNDQKWMRKFFETGKANNWSIFTNPQHNILNQKRHST